MDMNGRGLDLPQKVYTVYITTNRLNGKRYIGQHKTHNPNDRYLGSGVLLCQDVKRFGRENFNKEVLFIFNNFDEAGRKELELIKSLRPEYNVSLQGHYSGERGMAASPEARQKTLEKSKETFRKKREQRERCRLLRYLDSPRFCPKCGLMIPYEKKNNSFCSRSCANSKSHSKESRAKIQKAMNEKYEQLYNICLICHKKIRRPLLECKIHSRPSNRLNMEEYKRDAKTMKTSELMLKYRVTKNTICAWNQKYLI